MAPSVVDWATSSAPKTKINATAMNVRFIERKESGSIEILHSCKARTWRDNLSGTPGPRIARFSRAGVATRGTIINFDHRNATEEFLIAPIKACKRLFSNDKKPVKNR